MDLICLAVDECDVRLGRHAHGGIDRSIRGSAHPYTVLSLANWAFPFTEPPGSEQLGRFWWSLWYLRTYLWLIALSLLLLKTFRKLPKTAIVVPFLMLAPIGDAMWMRQSPVGAGALDALTYTGAWMLGFAHHDGMLHRLSKRAHRCLVGALSTMAVVLLVWDQTPGIQVTSRPLLNALWSSVFILVLFRWRPNMAWLNDRLRLSAVVRFINGRAMTIYLWHDPSILLATAILSVVTFPGSGVVVVPTLELVILAATFTVASVFMFGWVEDRCRPKAASVLRLRRPRHLDTVAA